MSIHKQKARHESAPQTRVRVDLGRFSTYDAAVDAASDIIRAATSDGDHRTDIDLQIRKRANGFHVYRRDPK